MPEGFPYGVYGRYGSSVDNSQENYSAAKFDAKVNRVCKNIANTVIRSARNTDDEDDEGAVMTFSLPKIPKDVVIFGSIVVFKILLYVAYKAASTHNMEILDI